MNTANDSLTVTSTSILAPPTGVSSDPDVRAFQALFPSSELAHTIGFPGSTPAFGQKAEWIYTTVRKPYAETDVQDHFAGRRSIVAIPILKDSTCHWGAIDIDVYGVLTLDALQQKCNALDLPLYCFPSKSGGAHLFAFFETAQTAARARQFLAFCMKRLGFPEAEIFPKQDVRPRVGNAINLPFFGSSDGLDEFSPRRCDPSQFELPALDEVKAKDDAQMGIPLKEGWDPIEKLQEAGLLFSTRTEDDRIYLDYHSETGLCLLQGAAHETQLQNNRQSCWGFYWCCFAHRSSRGHSGRSSRPGPRGRPVHTHRTTGHDR